MHSFLSLKTADLLDDIRSAAWLESELHPELDRHRRHQMADICEQDNIERVWRVLCIGEAEIRLALSRILRQRKFVGGVNNLERPELMLFRFQFSLPASTFSFIKEKTHEYLVAAVMAERTAVIIPSAASVWRGRAVDALNSLREASATTRLPSGPVRRPLWPL